MGLCSRGVVRGRRGCGGGRARHRQHRAASRREIRRHAAHLQHLATAERVDPRGSTIATNMPFMAVFNNLVRFDATQSRATASTPSCRSWRKAGPGTPRAPSSRSSCATASRGTTASRSRPRTCSAPGIASTAEEPDYSAAQPARDLVARTCKEVTLNGDHEVTFHLGRSRSRPCCRCSPPGYRPSIPATCRRRDMRTKPIGTGPFKFAEFKSHESDQARAQSRLLEEGPALSRCHRVAHHRQPLDARAGLRRRRVRHDVRRPT